MIVNAAPEEIDASSPTHFIYRKEEPAVNAVAVLTLRIPDSFQIHRSQVVLRPI